MRDSACRWSIVKKLTYFEVILNFEFSRAWEIVEYWLVHANKFPWISQSYRAFLYLSQTFAVLTFSPILLKLNLFEANIE